MKKIALISLGCAKNLVDSENILGLLLKNHYEIVNNKEEADSKEYQYSRIKVIHHEGKMCGRCWNYSDDALTVEDGTYICQRCKDVLEGK